MGANWLLDAAQQYRQRVEIASPLRDPAIDKGEIVERLRLVPDAPSGDFKCIGCGNREAPRKQAYCPRCWDLVREGVDLEAGLIPTERECRKALGWARGKRKKTTRYTDDGDTNG